MKCTTTLKRALTYLLFFSVFISSLAVAGDPLITGSFSGVWDQPEQESQGMTIQIGEQDGDKKVGIVFWYTFGSDFLTAWYLGIGPVTGNEIEMTLYSATGIDFMGEDLEGDESVVSVGTLNLVFKNCNHGIATYVFSELVDDELIETEIGEFPIKRISSIYRQRCSGGISDDTPKNGKPLMMEVKLFPVETDDSGEGKAKFWERTDRSDFKVEVEDVLDGDYIVRICADNENPEVEVKLFGMPVVNGEGELEFRSPEIDDKLNLNFDPRDCKIELLDGEFVVLTTGENVLSEKKQGKPEDEEDDDGVELEADFTNNGVFEDAEGEAEYEMETDEREFSVKIKNVPIGVYSVEVGGFAKGDLEVTELNGKTEGKAKFTDPKKSDTLDLNFDPRGQVIEIRQTAVDDPLVVLEVLFPDE
jgi:hypothetical protein